ncbi:hypothetical protein SAMN05877831_1141 [Rhodobacter maris]|uniref:Uncharacterized protein n=1 Tax=Rhodobacter maris TaxID=446682 RepID=A0A285T468_9RHOB|nr:hypothetical protein SAMN05877831_1141 [Rhodobacter maris]
MLRKDISLGAVGFGTQTAFREIGVNFVLDLMCLPGGQFPFQSGEPCFACKPITVLGI